MATQNPTSNYGWELPFPGASIGAWGEMLNAVFGDDVTGIDKILKDVQTKADAAMPKAGGTFTGPVLFSGTLTVDAVATFQKVLNAQEAIGSLKHIAANEGFRVGSTEVIDADRNVKNVNISAGSINSGVLGLARIPDLPWSKITSGVPVYATRWPNFSEIGSVPAALGRVAMPSGFGSVSLDGSSSGVAGIEFQDTDQLLFVSLFHQGVQTGGAWEWRFSGGELTIGTVPWGSVTGKPSTFAPSAHSHVVAQSTRPAGVEGRIWVKT